MTAPIIELKNVSLRFDREILKNINLKIHSEDSLVLVGPSGQGKSSLLRLMANLLSPNEGEVLWSGRGVAEFSKVERLDWLKKFGILFQQNALFDSMTVFQNVAFPLLETTELDQSSVDKRVNQYLNAVRLSDSAALFPSEISGGMQKRLGIARALALEPKVVLYDDPTAGLDPITSRHIVELIQDLKSKLGATIVTVTNDMNRAYQLAGRIIYVNAGSIIETGNRESTLAYSDPEVQNFIRGGASA